MQGVLKEFRTFILRGNLVDTAVGIVIGFFHAILIIALLVVLGVGALWALRHL